MKKISKVGLAYFVAWMAAAVALGIFWYKLRDMVSP